MAAPGSAHVVTVYPFLWQQAPRPWQIVPARGRQPAALRIGERTVPLADIAGVQLAEQVEFNAHGHLVMIGGFGFLALGFFLAVVSGVAQPRYVGGGVMFMLIAAFGLVEVMGRRPMRLLTLHIVRRDGAWENFSSADPGEVSALAEALAVALRAPAVGPAVHSAARAAA